MRALAEADLLTLWESGRHADPVRRALLLVQHAHPDLDVAELRQWPLGRRDEQLLSLRAATVGEEVACIVDCPDCGETLELVRSLDAVRAGLPDPDPQPVREIRIGALRCELRPPTSAIAERALSEGSIEGAEIRLRRECVRILQGADDRSAVELDAAQWAQVEEDLRQMDPWADLALDVVCGECGREWRAGFDIASFFWEELAQRARRVLHQVHRLARAYGWSEEEILGLGALRRQSYLDCLSRETELT